MDSLLFSIQRVLWFRDYRNRHFGLSLSRGMQLSGIDTDSRADIESIITRCWCIYTDGPSFGNILSLARSLLF